jgi:hypothetical protein
MATVNTVLGPIDANLIGETMSHVHLTIDIMCWFRPPDSGVLRGLSESRINLRNLGLVRRNAMLFKDNLVQDDLDLATNELASTGLPVARRLSIVTSRGWGATRPRCSGSHAPRGSISLPRPVGTFRRRIRPRSPAGAWKS